MGRISIANDQECITFLQAGESGALAYLVDHFYPVLCHFAEKIIDDKVFAQDIAEEAFIKLWNRHQDFSDIKSVHSFLYISARNACIDLLRKKEHEHKYLNHLPAEAASEKDFVLNEIIRAEVLADVYKAIETLPDQCRRVFTMSYIDGLKNNEIAEQLQLSLQTVKNHKMRALQLLRVRLQDKDLLLYLFIFFKIG